MDETAKPIPIDTQRTLEYVRNVFLKKILWLPVLALVLSLGCLLYSGEPLHRYWQPWAGVFVGAIAILYAIYQLTVSPPPMLVLTPEGLVYRNVSENLIPWQEIRDISVEDHSVRRLGRMRTYGDVTVIWLSVPFFHDRMRIQSLLARGPFWSDNIIRKEKLVGLVIMHELLSVAAQPLREEIRGRWEVFKGQPRAPLRPRASERRAANLRWEEIQYGVLFGLFVSVVALSLSVDYVELFARLGERSVAAGRQPAEPPPVKTAEPRPVETAKPRPVETAKPRPVETKSAEEIFNELWTKKSASAPPPAGDSNKRQGSVPSQPHGGGVGHRDAVTALAVPQDGSSFLSGGVDRTIKLWDAAGARVLRDVGAHEDIVRAVHLLPGDTHVLSADDDGMILLRTITDGKLVHTFDASRYGSHMSLAVSADGRRALSVHPRGANIVWDLEKKQMVKNLSDAGMGTGALSADGSLAITGGYDGALWLWDVKAGAMLRSVGYHKHGAHAVAFMPDGVHAISAGADFTVRLWSLETGDEVRAFTGHTGLVRNLAISADGKRVLSGSQFDGTARLWDVETGREIASIRAGPVTAVALLPDESLLIALGRDIKVWKPNGQLVRVFAGRGG